MHVLKVELEGLTTSFRYPHFIVGRQPSFPMPPPSTIYGHIASTLGDYPDPSSFKFAYTFTIAGTVDDFEYAYELRYQMKKGESTGKVDLNFNPVTRELLFQPTLTLYIAGEPLPVFHRAFLNPHFPVALGRSQDLAVYKSVEVINLLQAPTGYYEHTLLPWSFRPRFLLGKGVHMPRYIDPNDRQKVFWSRYVALEHRVFHPAEGKEVRPSVLVTDDEDVLWVDPTTDTVHDRQRIIVWHNFLPEKDVDGQLDA